MFPVISKLTDQINSRSSWKKAWLWLAFSQGIYFWMLQVTIPAVENQAKGMRIFDMLPFGYSHSYALALLNALGETGRNLYLTTQLPLDFIYPGLMGISGAMFLALLVKHIHSRLAFISLIPLVAASFDYGENLLILAMLKSFPTLPAYLVWTSSFSTIIKSLFTTLYLSLLLSFFGFIIYKRFLSQTESR